MFLLEKIKVSIAHSYLIFFNIKSTISYINPPLKRITKMSKKPKIRFFDFRFFSAISSSVNTGLFSSIINI